MLQLVDSLQDAIVVVPELDVGFFVGLGHFFEGLHELINHVTHSCLEVEDVIVVNFGHLELVYRWVTRQRAFVWVALAIYLI